MDEEISNINKREIAALAREAVRGIKTEQDLNDFSRMLKKVTVEAALNVELNVHPVYEKYQNSDNGNSRNGYTSKTLQIEDGQFDLDTPRDRKEWR